MNISTNFTTDHQKISAYSTTRRNANALRKATYSRQPNAASIDIAALKADSDRDRIISREEEARLVKECTSMIRR